MIFQKKLINLVIAQALVGGTALSASGFAFANDSEELENLRALVQELDQKVRILERKGQIAEEDAGAAKKSTPVVKANNSGFAIESADGKNAIRFKGVVQADYRHFENGANDVRNRTDERAGSLNREGFHDANSTALLRRVRPTIEGTFNGIYDFRFTPELAGPSATVLDAYIDAKLSPYFKIRAGKYKPFVGLERLQSAGDIKFVERSYVTNAILPNRDVGISIYGDVLGEKLSYAFGVNNGVVDGGNASGTPEWDKPKELTARLFATPFKDDANAFSGLGFGIAATTTSMEGEKNLNFTDTTTADATRNELPNYVSEGQQTFFRYGAGVVAQGKRTRVAPQAFYYNGPLGVIAEYAQVHQDVVKAVDGSPAGGGTSVNGSIVNGTKRKLNHDAWNVALSYLITGEDASFKGVKPKQDFDLDKGGWGAWEFVLRYSEINLDEDTFKNASGQYAGEFNATATAASAPTLAYADLSKSAKSASTWTAGINWYLNQNTKFQLDYLHTSFVGGALTTPSLNAAGGLIGSANATASNVKDRPEEDAIFGRLQVAF